MSPGLSSVVSSTLVEGAPGAQTSTDLLYCLLTLKLGVLVTWAIHTQGQLLSVL